MNARLAGWMTALSGGLAACGPAPGPAIPPEGAGREAPPAAVACVPPYARFANQPFWWADLDVGRSCTVFLEQDECVLGVFRDCTARPDLPREWQGTVDADALVRLSALFPESSGTRSRQPSCCVGPLVRAGEDPPWARLACPLGPCTGAPAGEHAGLYFEAKGPPAPDGLWVESLELPGPVVAVEADWALVAGGGEAVDGLYALAPSPVRAAAVEAGLALAVTAGGAPCVLAEHALVLPDGARVGLPERPLGVAVTSTRALVLLPSGILAASLADGAASTQVLDLSGDPVALTAAPDGRAFLLLRDPPTLLVLDGGLRPIGARPLSDVLEGAPAAPAWLEGRLAFVGRCHATAAFGHCLYVLDEPTGRLDRLGLPDGGDLGRPAIGPEGRWWIPDEAGLIHVVHPGQARPILSARFEIPAGGWLLARGPDGAWRLAHRSSRRISVLAASRGAE